MKPEINKKFFCIVNRDKPILSALVSSYVYVENFYTLMFEYSEVIAQEDNIEETVLDQYHISRSRAREFNIRLRNALNILKDCDNIVLVGLTDNQKSFLNISNEYNILEIDDSDEVNNILGPFTTRTQIVYATEDSIFEGLINALKSNALLSIGQNEVDNEVSKENDGLVVIENINTSSVAIAINYAFSISANVELVAPPKISKNEIRYHIEDWQNGNHQAFNDLSAIVYPSVEQIDFNNYEFSTFFTTGIPYSLILKNIIPFTHVHYNFRPDFFILNNILYEEIQAPYSAIVFSPQDFADEETNTVIKDLTLQNYYVKELIGDNATCSNIDYHIREYPFNLLHICSHGGEVGGYEVNRRFKDRYGVEHTVEFYEVVSIAPNKLEKLIPVKVKYILRTFNGFKWRSKELKAQEYSHNVYVDMHEAINDIDKNVRIPVNLVPNSCAIKCKNFNYQGNFRHLANHNSPVIFNNSCWSWSDFAHSFLYVGARGYIGTLWNINNKIAKDSAESFYSKVFKSSISQSLYHSFKHSVNTDNENIYIYYGLHFSTFEKSLSSRISKNTVARRLFRSYKSWGRHSGQTKNPEIIENVQRIRKWIFNELRTNFFWESLQLFRKR